MQPILKQHADPTYRKREGREPAERVGARTGIISCFCKTFSMIPHPRNCRKYDYKDGKDPIKTWLFLIPLGLSVSDNSIFHVVLVQEMQRVEGLGHGN